MQKHFGAPYLHIEDETMLSPQEEENKEMSSAKEEDQVS